jgi:hypothetical protein
MTLNRHLFTETGTDSGAINVLGTVVTRLREPGTYRIELFDGDQYLTHRTLVVSEEEHATQVDIDFASLPEVRGDRTHDRDCSCSDHGTLRLREGGYLLLYVSQGPGGFAATVHDYTERETPAFESRRLQGDEYFAVTLLRPGEYVARNEVDGSEFEFAVTRPDVEGTLEVPDEPLRVAVTDQAMKAEEYELEPPEGLVFEIETDARIVVEMVEEREKPDEPSRPPGRYLAGDRRPG